jgi:hypothetical protein
MNECGFRFLSIEFSTAALCFNPILATFDRPVPNTGRIVYPHCVLKPTFCVRVFIEPREENFSFIEEVS